LKEFSDFEAEKTPVFRHPPITGSKELDDIGLMTEIKVVNMFKYPDLRREHSILSNLEGVNIAKEASHEEFRLFFIEKMKQKLASEQIFCEISDQIQKFDGNSGNSSKIPISSKNGSHQAHNSMNSLNNLINNEKKNNFESEASISEDSSYDNDDMFEYRKIRDSLMRGFSLKEAGSSQIESKEFKELNNLLQKQSTYNSKNLMNNPKNLMNNSKNLTNNSKNLNSNSKILKKEDSIEEKTEDSPSFYYYKRWLWMIFPWACLSQDKKCNYSEQIIKSYSSATRYLSVLEENKYTKRALKIALEAKLKKKMIYGKKEEIEEEMNTLKNMKKEMRILELMNHHEKIEQANQNQTQSTNNNRQKRTIKLDPLKETISKKSNFTDNKYDKNNDKNSSNFFLTQDPLQKGPFNSLMSKSGRGKISFMKEKYRTYNEGNNLLYGLSIEEKSLRILPKLKDSITVHNKGALKVIEIEIKQLKTEYDDLLYSNKNMEKKLKELRFTQSNNNLFGTEKEDFNLECLKEKSMNLTIKLRENMDIFQETQQQKNRINTILTICKTNKMQNEEYIRSLNYLLMNFRKSIRKEYDAMKSNRLKTKDIRQISEGMVNIIGENLVNHGKLINQIKIDITNKMKFDASFGESRLFINGFLMVIGVFS